MNVRHSKWHFGKAAESTSEVDGFPDMGFFGPGIDVSIAGLRKAIGLAAAPLFAVMAVISGVFQDPAAVICSGGSGIFSLTGMVWMYILMSIVHCGAWLRLAEEMSINKSTQERSK